MNERQQLETMFCDGLPNEFLHAMLEARFGAATLLHLLKIAEWIPDEEYDWASCFRCSTIEPNHGAECEVGRTLSILKQFPIQTGGPGTI